MCGRFSQVISSDDIDNVFPGLAGNQKLVNYNVAPTNSVGVISSLSPNQLSFFKWGFENNVQSKNNVLINARSETIEEKPSFKNAFRQHRCIVLADSFYEWQGAKKSKQPFRIHFESKKIMLFAAIAQWNVTKGEYEFCIITQKATGIISSIHNRMPVFLQANKLAKNWLLDKEVKMAPYLKAEMEIEKIQLYPCNSKMNDVKSKGDTLHYRSKTIQLGLF